MHPSSAATHELLVLEWAFADVDPTQPGGHMLIVSVAGPMTHSWKYSKLEMGSKPLLLLVVWPEKQSMALWLAK